MGSSEIATGVAVLVLLVIPGALMLLSGFRKRRITALVGDGADGPLTWAPNQLSPLAPAPNWRSPSVKTAPTWVSPETAPAVRKSRGTRRIAVGSVLLGLGVLGLAGVAVDAAEETPIEASPLTLPTQVLGVPRHVGDLTADRQAFDAILRTDLEETRVGRYGKVPAELLVVAANGRLGSATETLTQFDEGLRANVAGVGAATDVDAGRQGGKGRCWPAPGSIYCVMTDETSIVMTQDTTTRDVSAAATRALEVRRSVLRR